MKKSIITIILALASVIIAAAQSTNPLNYSGRMYVETIEIIATPSCHSKCAHPLGRNHQVRYGLRERYRYRDGS